MKITEISLRRPVTVLIITIATVIFGVYSYMNMGVERMPNVEFPIVVVRKRRSTLPQYTRRVKVDTTDDKDIDVYGDDSGNGTN